ncbi:1-phosphofructokinase [Alteribacter populi]|uniref:1-phosphofructokinase n=1 Tax=Alteribacter populi TaxID=2011011 RepID=UPI000BBB3FCE|nr:1-phosphofructokinase [Alteribacter populi]
MITTITLNAALDKTYYLPSFSTGKTNRSRAMHSEPGGKGNNVAKVLHRLDVLVKAGGFVGGNNGQKIKELLTERGIAHDFIPVQGESRVCMSIIDEGKKEETELLEAGPYITEEEWVHLCRWVKRVAESSKIVTLSGSLPKGVPEDGYAKLIQMIQERGSKAILDSSGISLVKGIEKAPYAVKPNEYEIKQYVGKSTLSLSEFIDIGKDLINKGIQYVCISLGGEGALFITSQKVYRARVPELNVLNSVGSGDSMLAGLAAGFYKHLSDEEVITFASACGAANTLKSFAGEIEVSDFTRLKSQIKVEEVTTF